MRTAPGEMKIVQLKKWVEKYLAINRNRYFAKQSILLSIKMIKSKLEERRKKQKMFNAILIIHSISANHDFYDLVTLFYN